MQGTSPVQTFSLVLWTTLAAMNAPGANPVSLRWNAEHVALRREREGVDDLQSLAAAFKRAYIPKALAQLRVLQRQAGAVDDEEDSFMPRESPHTPIADGADDRIARHCIVLDEVIRRLPLGPAS